MKENDMKQSFTMIVVDYCSLKKTINYIEHAKDAIKTNGEFHCIIIDNTDSNENIAFINDYYKCKKIDCTAVTNDYVYCCSIDGGKLAYYQTKKNLGYAKGNNIGAKIAQALFDDPYILISNNDLNIIDTIDFSAIETIFNSKNDVAVIGPHIVGLDGKEQSPHKKITAYQQLIVYYWSMMTRGLIKWDNPLDFSNESKYCYRLMGSFMFIRAEYFYEVNGFDERTFLFAEEMILSEKFKKNNYKCYFLNDFTVIHEHGATVKRTAGTLRGLKWSYESCRYYYEHYCNTPFLLLKFADLNFSLYCLIYRLFHRK